MKIVMSILLVLMLSGTVHAWTHFSSVRSHLERKRNLDYERVMHEEGLEQEQLRPRKEQREQDMPQQPDGGKLETVEGSP